MSGSERPLVHICEVCDRTETLMPSMAFEDGWDYPPRMGNFGVASPRTCPDCPITSTLWWAVVMDKQQPQDLSDRHRATESRIAGEPETILPPSPSP